MQQLLSTALPQAQEEAAKDTSFPPLLAWYFHFKKQQSMCSVRGEEGAEHLVVVTAARIGGSSSLRI